MVDDATDGDADGEWDADEEADPEDGEGAEGLLGGGPPRPCDGGVDVSVGRLDHRWDGR